MNSPQNIQNAPSYSKISEEFENDSFILTPKTPHLRPADSPNIEFEELLLSEPLLGEEAFLEEDTNEELEDFFLEEEEDNLQKDENNFGLCQNKEKVEEKCQNELITQGGKSVRIFDRNLKETRSRNNFTNLTTMRNNSDYQMSKIIDNFEGAVDGVLEIISRKKSISIF